MRAVSLSGIPRKCVPEKINEVEKTTVVMVTHDSTIVDRFKKRTICLEEGYVVADIMKGGYLKHD